MNNFIIAFFSALLVSNNILLWFILNKIIRK